MSDECSFVIEIAKKSIEEIVCNNNVTKLDEDECFIVDSKI